jgi:hypothetical protein
LFAREIERFSFEPEPVAEGILFHTTKPDQDWLYCHTFCHTYGDPMGKTICYSKCTETNPGV